MTPKTPCPFEEKIIAFLKAENDTVDPGKIQDHLTRCSSCQQSYTDLVEVAFLLKKRARPQPTPRELKIYHRQLNNSWRREGSWNSIKKQVHTGWDWAFGGRSVSVRFVRVLALLLIGFFIGRIGIGTQTSDSRGKITPHVYLFPLAPRDRQVVVDYITESEIWLLAVVENTSDPNSDKLTHNKEIAHKLLFKTCSLEAIVSPLNNASLSGFLNQMEHVLLEVSNTQERDIGSVFEDIQRTIKETHLHQEPKRLQRMLHAAGYRGA